MRKIYKIIAVVAFLLVSAWGALSFLLWSKPQMFFYHPSQDFANLSQAKAQGYEVEEVRYKSADGTELYAWFTPPSKQNKIIVFYHGNAANIEGFFYKLKPLIQAGYGVMLPEYRGFGGLKGEITEPNLAADAEAAVAYLHRLGYKNSQIILYGMSLGSYTSSYVAAKYGDTSPFAGLILEVPFDALVNIVKSVAPILPVDLLVRDRYDNLAQINKIHTKLLVMIAGLDKTVPPQFGKNLFAQAPEPKKMIIYETAGHTNLYAYENYKDILTWLEADEETR